MVGFLQKITRAGGEPALREPQCPMGLRVPLRQAQRTAQPPNALPDTEALEVPAPSAPIYNQYQHNDHIVRTKYLLCLNTIPILFKHNNHIVRTKYLLCLNIIPILFKHNDHFVRTKYLLCLNIILILFKHNDHFVGTKYLLCLNIIPIWFKHNAHFVRTKYPLFRIFREPSRRSALPRIRETQAQCVILGRAKRRGTKQSSERIIQMNINSIN